MSFKEKGLVTVKTVDGKLQEEVESETIITLTNKITGKEYGSDAEADADVKNPSTPTKKEDLRRDVLIDIKKMPALLSKSNLVNA
jgi:hypothetical protein|tara:strand:- start:68 stop:322 length:255 start_codon:yes stop_codon:yes gene_type:complete